MGAVFAILFFLFSFGGGAAVFLAGTVGLIISGNRKKKGMPIPKGFTAVFSVLLSVGLAVTLIPIGFFGFIAMVNTMPPEGFVETDIVIEENGYQDTRFTADGVVYEALEFSVYDQDAISTPVFTYKTKGFLNAARCGNYYAIENNQGFNLISDKFGQLFCPVGEKETVIAYYTDNANLNGYYMDWDRYEYGQELRLSDHENNVIRDFRAMDLTSLTQESLILPDDAGLFEISMICKEELVYAESHLFVVVNDTLYYAYDTEVTDKMQIVHKIIELPAGMTDALLAIHKKYFTLGDAGVFLRLDWN